MQWIHTKDRLPELGRIVLLWNGDYVVLGALLGDSHEDPALFWYIDSVRGYDSPPMYWTVWIDPPAIEREEESPPPHGID